VGERVVEGKEVMKLDGRQWYDAGVVMHDRLRPEYVDDGVIDLSLFTAKWL